MNTDTSGVPNITIVSDSCYCPKQCPLWQRLVGKMTLRAGSRCSRAPRRFTWWRECGLSDSKALGSFLGRGWLLLPSCGLLAEATCHGGISSQDAWERK